MKASISIVLGILSVLVVSGCTTYNIKECSDELISSATESWVIGGIGYRYGEPMWYSISIYLGDDNGPIACFGNFSGIVKIYNNIDGQKGELIFNDTIEFIKKGTADAHIPKSQIKKPEIVSDYGFLEVEIKSSKGETILELEDDSALLADLFK